MLVVAVVLALPASASARPVASVKTTAGDAAMAIVLACHAESVPAGACQSFLTVAWCESRLDPNAQNGIYKGLFQLSPRHRRDPIIVALGWRNAYAEATHTIRYVKAHGFGEWQCKPDGGLRW